MGIYNQNHNLLQTTSQAFTILSTSSASGGTFGRIIDATHFNQFNLYVTSTVNGNSSADAYFRTEIWHTYASDQWYKFSSAMPGQQDAHNSYSLINFGPHVRVKWFLSTTNSTRAANEPVAATASATVRLYLSAKYDF